MAPRRLRLTSLVCVLILTALAVPAASIAAGHKPSGQAGRSKARRAHHKAKPAKTRSTPKPATTTSTVSTGTTTPTVPAGTTATAPQVPAVCPNAQASAANTTPQVLRAAVVCLVNQQRAERGLPGVSENVLLDTSAQVWTDTMVVTQVFSHGTDFTGRLAKVGYDWSNAGENIATGYETPATVI